MIVSDRHYLDRRGVILSRGWFSFRGLTERRLSLGQGQEWSIAICNKEQTYKSRIDVVFHVGILNDIDEFVFLSTIANRQNNIKLDLWSYRCSLLFLPSPVVQQSKLTPSL